MWEKGKNLQPAGELQSPEVLLHSSEQAQSTQQNIWWLWRVSVQSSPCSFCSSDLGSQGILLQIVPHKHPGLNCVAFKHCVKLFLRCKKLHDSLWAAFSHKALSPSFSDELNERNAVIKSLTKKLRVLETQHNDSKITLENTQQKFKELTQKVTDSSAQCQALEVGVQ